MATKDLTDEVVRHTEDEDKALADLVGEAENKVELIRRSFHAIKYYQEQIRKYENDLDEHVAVLDNERETIISFFKAKMAHAEERIERHKSSLWAYAVNNGYDKLSTPYGTVYAKESKSKVEVSDVVSVLDWARANQPGVIVKKEIIDKRKLDEVIKALEISPETIPGLTVIPPSAPFVIVIRSREST